VNAVKALGLLRGLGTPAFTTSDAAARLGLSVEAASKTLPPAPRGRLARLVRTGLWSVHDPVEPFALVEYLTPAPAYVSLQTALRLHGMIEQIPAVVYVVSLARSHRVRTTSRVRSACTASRRRLRRVRGLPPLGGEGRDRPRRRARRLLPLRRAQPAVRSLPELALPPGFRRTPRGHGSPRSPARLRTLATRRFEALTAAPERPN